MTTRSSDVLILGAGIAGLTLARQLLLDTDKRVVLLERRKETPPRGQKVGEATVQVSGYYLSKVLELEEHLLSDHYLKYNLRFFWKNAGRDNASYEDYGQSYIRNFSNIASYQLDRNRLETELLRLNCESERFDFRPGARNISVEVQAHRPHEITYEAEGKPRSLTAEWVVDASGRARYLSKQLGLRRPSPIRHGSSFVWVDGLINPETLTDQSRKASRLSRDRAALGHAPMWLATNHFMGDGFWVWLIPLPGRTSIGVVFDRDRFPTDRVGTAQGLVDWLCEEFPLFARELGEREVLHFGGFGDFAYDCAQTINASKWALTGEAGRFSDPLYSPGGDLIALHNSLICAAVQTSDPAELTRRTDAYEQLLKAVYQAYVPSYTTGYESLADQEAYSLKYTWELTVYFALYVFPFINDLFTDRRFIISYLRYFSTLGVVNDKLQHFLGAFSRWKADQEPATGEPVFLDFTDLGPLRTAERTFYEVGVSVSEARRILTDQLANLEELARYTAAHVASRVCDDPGLLTNGNYVRSIDLQTLTFDPQEMHRQAAAARGPHKPYEWSFDPCAMDAFRRPLEAGKSRPLSEMAVGAQAVSVPAVRVPAGGRR